MKKRQDRVSQYIDIEASESEPSEYSSEDVGPGQSEEFGWEGAPSTAEEESSEVESVGVEEEVVSQHNLLPSKFSPKLWLIRVKNGKERTVMLKLSSKAQPISVICKDDLHGYIYIESFAKQKVIEALEDVSETLPDLEEGKFARVRSGKYKEDLVQVIEVVSADLVRVRLVPRINGVRELFDSAKYNCAKSKGYYIFKRDCYKDGFLEKEMLAKNLTPTVDLNAEETALFGVSRPVLCIGDKVRIMKGDLRNMVGTVKNIFEDNVTLKTDSGEYQVSGKTLEKYFDIGDEVSYKGQNGVVVKMERGECIVLIGFDREVKARIGDLGPPVFGAQHKVNLNKRPRIRRDPLYNKEVDIRAGEYKGYRGVVRDVYRESCRVQLSTDMRNVNVMRNDLALVQNEAPAYEIKEPEYKTPGYKTPGYKTPGYKTPSYKTPGYKTPGYKTPQAYAERSQQWTSNLEQKFSGAVIVVGERECVLKDIRDGKYVTEDGAFDRDEVGCVAPAKYDRVCVLEGDEAGKSGILVAVNNNTSVIRAYDGSFISAPFGSITKIP
ncbi:UNVERIFIED_CONTAM: hypothetical protein PYX00_010877 [Menopon gallinae]|uniref:KOW domain-containing protein n=1 Tax=Menopon gallinae TaxID=328185 RepID=A0AAW2H6B8_9NEOP